MANVNKTLLLAITGVSPAVVTETLYGMDKQGKEWPKKIKIITTLRGKEHAIKSLINDEQITKLCQEIGKPAIEFNEDDILVIKNSDGVEVDDAISLDDHEALANFIMTKVHKYTSDDTTKVHASIAGGRKTMTFYLGYAMSLFGRHFDELSHVLVTEGFENPGLGFFFPTRNSFKKKITNWKDETKTFDFKDAEVTLADIPFIRQRNLMPRLIKEPKHGEDLPINFRHLVKLVNLGDAPENIKVEVFIKEQLLKIYSFENPAEVLEEIKISSIFHWALYILLLEEGTLIADERCMFTRPKKRELDTGTSGLIIRKIASLLNLKNIEEPAIQELIKQLIDHNDAHFNIPKFEFSLKSIKDGINGDRFSDYIRVASEALEQALPLNLAKVLSPAQIYKDELEKSGKGGDAYGIALPNPKKQIIFK